MDRKPRQWKDMSQAERDRAVEPLKVWGEILSELAAREERNRFGFHFPRPEDKN